jgi:hypothetical protein
VLRPSDTVPRLSAYPIRIGESRSAHRDFVEKPEGKKEHLEDLDINRWIILKWLLKKWKRGRELDGCGLGQGEVGVFPR